MEFLLRWLLCILVPVFCAKRFSSSMEFLLLCADYFRNVNIVLNDFHHQWNFYQSVRSTCDVLSKVLNDFHHQWNFYTLCRCDRCNRLFVLNDFHHQWNFYKSKLKTKSPGALVLNDFHHQWNFYISPPRSNLSPSGAKRFSSSMEFLQRLIDLHRNYQGAKRFSSSMEFLPWITSIAFSRYSC